MSNKKVDCNADQESTVKIPPTFPRQSVIKKCLPDFMNQKSQIPIEPDKEISTWFGVMTALFFLGGIFSLIAFGIGGPLAFLTLLMFVLAVVCMAIAARTYPRAEKIKPGPEIQNESPKDNSTKKSDSGQGGLLVLILVLAVVLIFGAYLITPFVIIGGTFAVRVSIAILVLLLGFMAFLIWGFHNGWN